MNEILIIGAGPAGLSAAAEFHRHGYGKSVTILEREDQAGGIPRHCGHRTFGLWEFGRLMSGPDYVARLADQIGDCQLRMGTSVLHLGTHGDVRVTGAQGEQEIRPGRILLCTGMRESPRSQYAIAGARPKGVMNTGRLQQHIYLYREAPFQSPIILGSELVAFSAILTLRHAGIRPRALIEEDKQVRVPLADWAARLLWNVPVLSQTKVRRIIGSEKIEGIDIERGFGLEFIKCDGLILSGRFRPENALLIDGPLALTPESGPIVDQNWRSSNEHFFAAGNLLGRRVQTAGTCWRQGKKAAQAIIRELE